MKQGRFFASLCLALLVLAAIAWVPLPCRVMTDLVLRPDGAQHLYVSVPGTLRQIHVTPGTMVDPGEVILELENLEIQLQLAQLEGEQIRYQAQLESFQSRRTFDSEVAASVTFVREALADVNGRLEQLRQDADRLQLRADRTGTVIPATEQPEPQMEDSRILPSWSGTPFEPRNLGALLSTGTPVCMVGDPQALQATMLVPEADIRLVREGQTIELVLDELPWRKFSSHVREIAEINLDLPPRELTMAAGGPLPTQEDPLGTERPQRVMYAVAAPLDVSQWDEPLLPGFRGRAKILVEPQSLGTRLVRLIRNTIHFR